MNAYTADIQKLYIAYFGRPADPQGLAFWETQAASAGNIAAVAAAFSTSPEYQALYAGKTNAQIVDAVYVNLLGRQADPAGLAFWVAPLDAKTLDIGSIVRAIIGAAQNAEGVTADKLALANKAAAVLQFTPNLDTAAEISAYSTSAGAALAKTWLAGVDNTPASLAAATASLDSTIARVVASAMPPAVDPPPVGPMAFTLTAGADVFTGQGADDVFIAAAGTLNAGDVLNGGGGFDILRVTASGQTLAGTLSSIEEIRLIDSGAFNAAAADLGKIAFGHASATDTGDVTLVVDLGSSASFDLGGVTAGQAGTVTSRIKASYTNAAAGALDATLSGLDDTFSGTAGADIIHGGDGDDSIFGGDDNDTIHGGAGADSLNGDAGDDIFVGFEGQDTVDGGTGTNTLKLDATSADLNTATEDQLVNVQGVDASAAAAGVTVNLSAQSEGFIVNGSAHADVLQGGAGADQLSGGNGDDTFVGFAGADSIDGGSGMNTLRLTATSSDLNAAANAQLMNVKYVDASTAATGVTVDLSSQSDGFSITGSAHADTLSGSSGNDVISGGDGDDVLIGGIGADTLIGGNGADSYVYNSIGGGGDVIQGFEVGLDTIRLRGGDFAAIDGTHIKAISGSGTYNGGAGYAFDGGAYALLYTDTWTGKTSLIVDDNGNDTAGAYSVMVTDFSGVAVDTSVIVIEPITP